MDENAFKPELNEEIFDIVDSAIEEELEKLGIPKRIKYELLNSINKNMEKKFENTRVQVSHIVGPVGPVKKETISLADHIPPTIEHHIFKDGLQQNKVENSTRMNNDVQPVGYTPQFNETTERLANQIEELNQLK